MYSVEYQSDTGEKFIFGANGGNVFDMDLGNGLSVDLGTSQGFSQVGETVETQSLRGRTITVKGALMRGANSKKEQMRKVFAPFTRGRLIFGKKQIRVFVKNTPTFSPIKEDGRFTMQFFAPNPFFTDIEEQVFLIGAIKPQFSFPVNYDVPHRFGSKAEGRYANIVNNGDVKVPFVATLCSNGVSSNIVLANLKTLQTLRLNGSLTVGECVKIYRDENNILRAEKTAGGVTTDVIARIDDELTLFELNVGDNIIAANDDEGGANLTVRIAFSPAVVAVYES